MTSGTNASPRVPAGSSGRAWRSVLAVSLAVAVPACAPVESVKISQRPDVPSVQIPIEIVRPEGAGPFAAVVWLHSCAGLRRGANHVRDWTRRLVQMGYVVAIPDSFTPRGHADGVCGYGMRVPPPLRAEDAYATVRHLASRPDVRPDRIGAIGHSHGGWSVLATLDRGVAERARAVVGAQHGFAAAIAYYPDCAHGEWVPGYRPVAPLLILAGALDDWTPASPCQRLADHARQQGHPVSLTIYPGAHHSFDTYLPLTRVPEALQGRGATIGGNPAARDASIEQVRVFFGTYLKGQPAARSGPDWKRAVEPTILPAWHPSSS